jgi:hypothetical protein
VRESAVDVPEFIRLHAVEVDDLRARSPLRIVLEKIGNEVVTVVGNNGDCLGLANRECVHHDLVGMVVGAVCDRAVEVREVVRNLFGEDLKSASLHGKDTGVEPVPLRLDGWREPEKIYLRFQRLKTPVIGHEFIRIDERDVRNQQRRQIDLREEESVEVDVYNRVRLAFEYRKEFRKDRSHAGSVV